MNLAYRRDPSNARNIFVADMVFCKGVPFYGYHVGWTYYLKIYLLSPFYVNKLADLFRNGLVMGKPVQPFEAHIPYLLHFFADFNLTGCGIMKLSTGHFRLPLPEGDDGYAEETISPDFVLSPMQFPRLSHCELEIDIDASAIQNRYPLKQRDLHYDFKEGLGLPSSDTGFISTLAGIWTDEANRRHNEGNSSFQPPLEHTQRIVGDPPWRRYQELKKALHKLVESDNTVSEEDFLNLRSDTAIPTVFESVSAMFDAQVSKDVILEPLSDNPEENTESELQQDKSPVEKTEIELNEAPEPEPIQEIIISEVPLDVQDLDLDFEFDDSASSTSEKTENEKTGNVLDPLSQDLQLENMDFSDSEFDSFGSFTDSIILNEISLQKSILEVMRKDPSTQSMILSQEDVLGKRPLSQSSLNSRPSSKSFRSESEYGNNTFSTIRLPSSSNPVSVSRESVDSSNRSLISTISKSFPSSGILYGVKSRPPTATEVMSSFESFGLPEKLYKQPHFSNPKDVPPKPVIFAGLEFRLKGDGVQHLLDFSFDDFAFASISHKLSLFPHTIESKQLRYAHKPPSYRQVLRWSKDSQSTHKPNQTSQIKGVTQKYDFKYATQKRLESRKSEDSKYLSLMTVEVHVNTRGDLHPDPACDKISAIFWSYQSEYSEQWDNKDDLKSGAIFLCKDKQEVKKYSSVCKYKIQPEETELDVINSLVYTVRRYDPDILSGYEINSSSWGYIIERGKQEYDIDLCDQLSRVRDLGHGKVGDKWGNTHTSAISVTGRHMFNVWRIIRNEVNLLKYSLENVVYHTIHHRLPYYSYKTLTTLFSSTSVTDCACAVRYHFDRVFYTIDVIKNLELISRTSEQARIVGIDFYSVFYRGSQYKVESIMCRLTKAENFMMISPSRKQVGEQNALECLPLILEPQTKLYTSPVVVLDFQSLYPSIMIAYNYCYSTCLGRLRDWRGRNKVGFTDLELPEGLLAHFKDEINIAPNGMIYVKQEVRKSLLAKMLGEILETRVMVKDGMKSNKDNSSFQKLMNNRQLALKLIANVTYGYTSASYSGRMPCVEIADSIVQSARETLEKAIDLIKSNPKWGADVVYGDTDSLFLHFPGKTKDQAFDLGQEIAQEVTNMNPRPVKLKFEKVYLPCILQTKKRYVGHMYEYKAQKEPIFDAKGIETIRRDGTPAQQKIVEKSLDILFRTCDLSQVKTYLEEQWLKIMTGKVSVQDFCFSKEVKLGSYRGLPPPGALISAAKVKMDANAAPQYRERVPYVVISGAPGDRLMDRCVSPDVLINNPDMRLDSEYYITKNLIPPLERIFHLVGGNVRLWYDEMPKVLKFHQPIIFGTGHVSNNDGSSTAVGPSRKKSKNLRHFLIDTSCRVCLIQQPHNQQNNLNGPLVDGVCSKCRRDPFTALYTLTQRHRAREKSLLELTKICQQCSGISPAAAVECESGDCPIYYSRKRAAVFYKDSCERDVEVMKSVVDW